MSDGPPCPRCGAVVLGGDGWVAWSPACDHGVVSQLPEPAGRIQRWRDDRRRAVDDRIARQIAAGGGKAGVGPAFLVATLVHLLTVACLVGGAYLTVTTWFVPLTLLGPVLIAIGIFVRPRLPRGGDLVAAAQVPALAAYVAEIAAASAAPRPRHSPRTTGSTRRSAVSSVRACGPPPC